jgi:hypothetical protein
MDNEGASGAKNDEKDKHGLILGNTLGSCRTRPDTHTASPGCFSPACGGCRQRAASPAMKYGAQKYGCR